MDKAMLADAIATACGAVCGTSTAGTYVEASAGIAEGGKTGLSAMVTGALFFISLFLSPIALLVPAFMTLAMMPMTYNISYGIAFGVISHVLISVFTGKAGEIKTGTWVIAVLFSLMFFVTH